MSIPTHDEIRGLLDRFDDGAVADDLESTYLDFKPWRDAKKDMAVAVEYAVCFANAEGGAVVFGVSDKKRGRKAAIHGAGGYDIDVWRRGIFDATTPHLKVEVEELAVPEGTGQLLVVRVAKGDDPPYGTAQGLFKVRIGKNCMPLDPRTFTRRQVTAGAVDWSAQPVPGVAPADLDPVEIARARNILRSRKTASELLELSDAELLTALGAVREGRVTCTGLLLFGREDLLFAKIPQHQVHYAYQSSDTELLRNDFFRCGLLQVLERIGNYIDGPVNPEKEVLIGFAILRIPAFPPTVVREALLNAVTHRSYADPHEVFVHHTERELRVLSPGGFLGGITPQNILRHDAVSRNPALAEAFQKMQLVEKAGIGRRRIFVPMLEYGKKVPVYETDLDGKRVILRLYNGKVDSAMAILVARFKEAGRRVGLDELLVLAHLREHPNLDVAAAERVLQLPQDAAREILEQCAHPESGFLERDPERVYRLTPEVRRTLSEGS